MPLPAETDLQGLQQALHALRQGTMVTPAFVRVARNQAALALALPARFDEVLQRLLDRLESAALFSEESCSFSQQAVLDSLQDWLDKASDTLASASTRQP